MQYLSVLISILLWSFTALAQNVESGLQGLDTANISNPMKVVSVSSAPEGSTGGSRFPINLSLSLPDGFHAYEDKFKMRALVPEGTQISDILLKSPATFTDFSGKVHKGLVTAGTLEFFVELPAQVDSKIENLKFDLEYIACTKKYCLPKNTLSVEVPVHMASTNSTESAAANSNMSYIEQKLQENLLIAFFLVFAFGFLTSLTPCVYPLIPITLAVIGARAKDSRKYEAFMLSLVYVLGIAMTYSVLGVVAAKTGALFGQALSYPPVVIFFAFLFFLMGLSLFGLFEIRAPHFITNKLSKSQSGSGYAGAFISGLVAGVIASPCVGPVLVGILAYIAKTQDVVLGFTLLFTFAMGMGVLFIILGTSSSLLKKLPKSGGWMNAIKYTLGVFMIILGLYYLKPLLTTHSGANSESAQEAKVPLKNGWMLYTDKLLEQAKADGKPVMIDFYAEWCGACVELDKHAFSKPGFIEASKAFVLLKVDATESYPELAVLQKRYEVYGLPTVVFITKSGALLKEQTLTGFEEADKIIERMKATQAAP